MKLLFCCQHYPPSTGGVSELMRQLAEGLAGRGHEVVVATSAAPERTTNRINGVQVRGFDVSGNLVKGMAGEIREYRKFLLDSDADVVLIYAAQQWTFDALWEIWRDVKPLKVFMPSGFAGLHEPAYRNYYRELEPLLRFVDWFVFNAGRYRDIDHVKSMGLRNFSVVPNAASRKDFLVKPDAGFRGQLDIKEEDFVFLTVGSFSGLKGHMEVVTAFEQMPLEEGRNAVLIMNGNEIVRENSSIAGYLRKIIGLLRNLGPLGFAAYAAGKLAGNSTSPRRIAARINARRGRKKVLVLDLPRNQLVQAFAAADLFVFASNIEYSPLVLFEAAAAGTPFLTVDVGNSSEIAAMTGAGRMCPSTVDGHGYTRVDVAILAAEMARCMGDREGLAKLGATGRRRWLEEFTWEHAVARYERIFRDLLSEHGR